jgi:hypothetical protein
MLQTQSVELKNRKHQGWRGVIQNDTLLILSMVDFQRCPLVENYWLADS